MSLILDGTAGVNSSGPVVAADGTVSLPGIAFGSDLDNGAYRIGTNNWALAVGGAKVMEFTAAGEILAPTQPMFMATGGGANNVTGGDENYHVIFGTEVIDQNADYNPSTGNFTAPVTGTYDLSAGTSVSGLGVNQSYGIIAIVTSNRTYRVQFFGGTAGANTIPGAGASINVAAVDMDAGDTAYVDVQCGSSTTIVDIVGGTYGYFSGRLAG